MNEYQILYYSAAVEQEISNLPFSLLARFDHYKKVMQMYGPNLRMPHSRAMRGGLFELRLTGKELIGRVFYGTLVGRRIVMLHSFVKKTQKTPNNELKIARKRLEEIKKNA